VIELFCSNCNKSIIRTGRKRHEHSFCSKECEMIFKHNQFYEERFCPICDTPFETTKIKNKIYCGLKCQIEWQRQNPRTGKNHPCYIPELHQDILCGWCDKSFDALTAEIENGKRFCSNICRQAWYAQVWSQSKEWSDKSKIRATKILEEGLVAKADTRIQRVINGILDSLLVEYSVEKGFIYFSADNYLIQQGLVVENMGTYWHCDHRKYPEIIYERHVSRIKQDKAKHSYFKNNYGIEILYLWESEIMNNPNLCKLLILKYIENNGVLFDYHSFNYSVDGSELILNNDIQTPYMNQPIEYINTIVNIKTGERRSMKQPEKWTTYNCECCGKEKEQLTSHYVKANHHACSYDCAHKLRRILHTKEMPLSFG